MKYIKSLLFFLLCSICLFVSCSKKNVSDADLIDTENYFLTEKTAALILGEKKISFECRINSNNAPMIPLDKFCEAYGYETEVCGRCGQLKVFTNNEEKDVLLVEWNSPEIVYQNKQKKLTLRERTVYENGITWVSVDFLNYL